MLLMVRGEGVYAAQPQAGAAVVVSLNVRIETKICNCFFCAYWLALK